MSALAHEDRWANVRRIFDAAVDLPAELRRSFLDRECGDDTATRAEVEELLVASDSAVDLPADRAAATPEVAERMPEILGYRLERRLAHGGSSRVYEATSLENGRTVAIKVISSGASASALQRFRQECRVLSRLDHPGIVRLYETGHTPDGHVYLSMEFIHGLCIDRHVAEHASSDLERIGLVIDVLDALSHAHAAGVIHRDLKPHNILVDGSGRARLVDFGVARLNREDGHRTGFHTETGNLVGTFAYMSPEQADGKNGRIGPATDVYQCAVVLYELLAGRLPYDIEDRSAMSLLKAVLFDARSPLGAVAPRFSGAMDRAINRALSADPADRPQSAAMFAEQLRQAAQELRRG
jgi:serine/threonine protein kinase